MNELRFFTEKADINLLRLLMLLPKPFGLPHIILDLSRRTLHTYRSILFDIKSKEYGLHTKFIELAGEVNESMPAYITQRIGS